MARRQQTCPFEQSNLANFGTDLEKNIKRAAAECERAWDGAGQREGIRIWRIEKFKVVDWPRNQIGKFYNGDSYIILHSYQQRQNAPLKHDIHFWLGETTSQDEAGTAAYKTVELDDRLGGAPVQHREVQGHESDLFMSYFPENTIEVMEGGIESGFHHVEAVQHPTRLFQVKGIRQNVRVNQVALNSSSLNSGDVFILDLGTEIIQWNGRQSSLFEKMRASQVVHAIKEERGGRPDASIYDEGDNEPGLNVFWQALGGKPARIKSAAEGGSDQSHAQQSGSTLKLFRLTDRSGQLVSTLEKQGDLKKTDLDSNDTFILDNGDEVFVWIGKRASANERKFGMQQAERYLRENNRPLVTPISRVVEGGENSCFNLNFSDAECSRDLDFSLDQPFQKARCCPHYPEGNNGWAFTQNQPSAVSQLAAQQYGGRRVPGAAPHSQAPPAASPADVQRASREAFSFFKNAERMNNAASTWTAPAPSHSTGLYNF